jgi:hypothetical protein
VLGDEDGDAGWIDGESEAIPDGGHGREVRGGNGGWHMRGEFGEVLLEAGRTDELEEASRGVAGVPEGVGDTAGLDDKDAGTGGVDLITDLDPDSALQDKGILVFIDVSVDRCAEGAGFQWMLDDREGASGPGAIKDEAHAEAAEPDGFASVWTNKEIGKSSTGGHAEILGRFQ